MDKKTIGKVQIVAGIIVWLLLVASLSGILESNWFVSLLGFFLGLHFILDGKESLIE